MRAAIIGVSWCKCGLIAVVISFQVSAHWITCQSRSRGQSYKIRIIRKGLIFPELLTLLLTDYFRRLAGSLAGMVGFWVSNSCKFMEIFNEGYFVNSHPLETNISGGNLHHILTSSHFTPSTCVSIACFDSRTR